LTFSGKLVANDIQASVYVSYQNTENLMLGSGTTVAVTWQWLAQTFLLPARWMGASLAAPLKVDMFFWLPSFFLAFENALVSILMLPAPLLLPFAVPVLGVMGVISLMEHLVLAAFSHTLIIATLILTVATIHHHWKVSGMTIKALKKKVV